MLVQTANNRLKSVIESTELASVVKERESDSPVMALHELYCS